MLCPSASATGAGRRRKGHAWESWPCTDGKVRRQQKAPALTLACFSFVRVICSSTNLKTVDGRNKSSFMMLLLGNGTPDREGATSKSQYAGKADLVSLIAATGIGKVEQDSFSCCVTGEIGIYSFSQPNLSWSASLGVAFYSHLSLNYGWKCRNSKRAQVQLKGLNSPNRLWDRTNPVCVCVC